MPGSLSLDDARTRSRTIRQVLAYEVLLDVRDPESFTARTTVAFDAVPGGSTFLDLQHAREVRASLNGTPVPEGQHRDDRVRVDDLAEHNVVEVHARLPYVTDGDGLHRFVDPADGQVYLGCYGGMDVARRVFACFDQPDLKAPFRVSVIAPEGWTVLSNGVGSSSAGTWTFSPTPPVATYLVTVCAGPWVSRRWEHAGLTFGWHCRASQRPDLDRDLPELRSVTEAAYDHYARLFTEPYAFGDYDQVFAPGHNWGAMETPGCVTFRDELLPAGTTDPALTRRRAMTIAHEMAHMWFGDLVTFRWWEDTWLNESFADYMGFIVGGAALPGEDALAEFDLSHKSGGYAADLRPSSHPVAPLPEDVPDVDTAYSNFDSISYAKGNACLRQLAFWLGQDTFLAGVDRHLTERRFGTACLDDLVGSLQSVTDRDVRAWTQAWLRTTGHDTVRVLRAEDDAGTPCLRRTGTRPHRLRVSGYARLPSGGLVPAWERVVDLGADDVALPGADLVVPNSTGDTFARVVLDERSWETVQQSLAEVPDEHPRALLWGTVLDAAARGDLDVRAVVALVGRHLPAERATVVLEHVLTRTVAAVQGAAAPTEVPDLLERLSGVALGLLAETPVPAAARHTAAGVLLAATHDPGLLRRWLGGGGPDGALPPAQRWDALLRLAVLGEEVEHLVRAERARDASSAAELASLSVGAAVPDAAAKRGALGRMLGEGISNRQLGALARGLWQPEQRPVVDPLVAAYLEQAPGVAARGQAIGLVVGRAAPGFRWTERQLVELGAAVARPDLPPVLARTWEDLLHDQGQLAGRVG